MTSAYRKLLCFSLLAGLASLALAVGESPAAPAPRSAPARGPITPFSPVPPVGTLSWDGPCTLARGTSTCNVLVSWTANVNVCLWLPNGQNFACGGPTGSAVWPWTSLQGNSFILRYTPSFEGRSPNDQELGRLFVHAEPPLTGTLSSDGPCTLAPGAWTCAVQVSWTASGNTNVCLWLPDGQVFACGGPTGSAIWRWASLQGQELIMRATASYESRSPSDPELARLTVHAVPAPLPPFTLFPQVTFCVVRVGAAPPHTAVRVTEPARARRRRCLTSDSTSAFLT
jgi:hypothetical protein